LAGIGAARPLPGAFLRIGDRFERSFLHRRPHLVGGDVHPQPVEHGAEFGGGVSQQGLVADPVALLLRQSAERALGRLGPLQPEFRVVVDEGHPLADYPGLVGALALLPPGVLREHRVDQRVDHVPAVAHQEEQPRLREERHQGVRGMRAVRLLDHDPARVGDLAELLELAQYAPHVERPQFREGLGQVPLGEEVMGVVRARPLPEVLPVGEGMVDRDQMQGDVALVDHRDPRDLGEQLHQPGAAGAR
jgi:hypothetical protein